MLYILLNQNEHGSYPCSFNDYPGLYLLALLWWQGLNIPIYPKQKKIHLLVHTTEQNGARWSFEAGWTQMWAYPRSVAFLFLSLHTVDSIPRELFLLYLQHGCQDNLRPNSFKIKSIEAFSSNISSKSATVHSSWFSLDTHPPGAFPGQVVCLSGPALGLIKYTQDGKWDSALKPMAGWRKREVNVGRHAARVTPSLECHFCGTL